MKEARNGSEEGKINITKLSPTCLSCKVKRRVSFIVWFVQINSGQMQKEFQEVGEIGWANVRKCSLLGVNKKKSHHCDATIASLSYRESRLTKEKVSSSVMTESCVASWEKEWLMIDAMQEREEEEVMTCALLL